ncbi:hypothetical protein CLOHAE12215_01315 [Clostridium haemolyticum]|uniref:hypothetical protein n=1 Tax=Clostridium haemolyticum TaxID=84025 RepID=UPI001C3A60E6|nr:hypothetical protein [Clostridium haemolyticum]CAG7839899.1 hypothetical protein CLOHAE12215_01315 [Clostridium haemolyticum]
MEIKLCSKCKLKPKFVLVDELGMIYSYECPKCGKRTQNVLCPSATIDNPNIDKETKNRLIKEWNSEN